jgi:hypothetical protein
VDQDLLVFLDLKLLSCYINNCVHYYEFYLIHENGVQK